MSALVIHPWPDPIIDTLGHDPRSEYVERFWLPTLGPTSLLLIRRLAAGLSSHPEGMSVAVGELSQALGLGNREGASSPLLRSFERLTQFDLACSTAPGKYAVRRSIPPVNLRHIRRLPDALQSEHRLWAEAQLAEKPLAIARRRARRIAFTLLEQGDDADLAERALHDMGFHPAICRESAQWAYERHRAALEAALAEALTPAANTNPAA
ncbi:MAG: hypothetical protein EXQ69_04535 [Acidimicrobiia bacterium]|nr:hypothetical protein [Acidimicrobiia bacterium]